MLTEGLIARKYKYMFPGRLLVSHKSPAPLQRLPMRSVTALELAAVGDVGLRLQHLHRVTAQLLEQPDTGKHAARALTDHSHDNAA